MDLDKSKYSRQILLDTNALIAAVGLGKRSRARYLGAKVRLAAFACEGFLVTAATRREFESVLRAKAPSLSGLESERGHYIDAAWSAFEELKPTVIDEGEVLKASRRDRRDEIWAEISALAPASANERVLWHDMALLLVAEQIGAPLLSFDRKIQALTNEPLAEIALPFPFDISRIARIPLPEILQLSSPLRELYQRALSSLQEHEIVAQTLIWQDETKEDVRKITEELRREIDDLVTKEAHWRHLAKPDGRRTLLWTAVEVAVGMLPIPIPTSPLNYFLDLVRYRREKHGREGPLAKPLQRTSTRRCAPRAGR